MEPPWLHLNYRQYSVFMEMKNGNHYNGKLNENGKWTMKWKLVLDTPELRTLSYRGLKGLMYDSGSPELAFRG